MTHMHIPDGVLPVWLWLFGLTVMLLVVCFCVLRLRTMDLRKKIPLLGAVSAAMLVAMSLEVLPIAYHINLSVVAGILLGPILGFLAAFITNLILALVGHGGVTVIGLNTLLLGAETILGHTLFFVLKRRLTVFWSAAGATVLTLLVTTLTLIGIVAISYIDPELVRHGPEHGPVHEQETTVTRFSIIVLSLGLIGWMIEAFITGTVVRFISQVKPDLLGHVLHKKKHTVEQRSEL